MKNTFQKIGSFIKSHVILFIILILIIVVAIILVSYITGTERRAIKKYLSALNSCDVQKILNAEDSKAMIAFEKGYYLDENGKESSEDFVKNFDKAISSVTDEEIQEYEDGLKSSYEGVTKGADTIKLVKIVSNVEAKDNKDLKNVICKIRVKSKPVKESGEEEVVEELPDDSIEAEEDTEVEEVENTVENEEVTEEELEDAESIDVEDVEPDGSDEEGTFDESEIWKERKDFTQDIELYVSFIIYKDKVLYMSYDYE